MAAIQSPEEEEGGEKGKAGEGGGGGGGEAGAPMHLLLHFPLHLI